VPVVILSGHLGSGKTTLLNHLLRQPGARVGVIVNDFGEVNIDAGLVSGQIDDPASIAGGCLCCLPDAGGLDDALAKLTGRGLDVVIIEASGIAEPGTLAQLIRVSRVDRVRPGGVIEVVDAVEYFRTLDTMPTAEPPARFDAATLVVINKGDLLPADGREQAITRIEQRVRERNERVPIIRAVRSRIDPALVYDVAATEDPADQLPIGALLRAAHEEHQDRPGHGHAAHQHAASVTVARTEPTDPDRLATLLEEPPATAYRIKGVVAVATPRGPRRYLLNVVGRTVDLVAASPTTGPASELVAIGLDLDADDVRARLEAALAPAQQPTVAASRRLHRYLATG